MGKLQYEATYSHDKPLDSSPAIMDMYGSARPKVYAIIQLMRRHELVVDMIEKEYKIQVYDQSTQDQVCYWRPTELSKQPRQSVKAEHCFKDLLID